MSSLRVACGYSVASRMGKSMGKNRPVALTARLSAPVQVLYGEPNRREHGVPHDGTVRHRQEGLQKPVCGLRRGRQAWKCGGRSPDASTGLLGALRGTSGQPSLPRVSFELIPFPRGRTRGGACTMAGLRRHLRDSQHCLWNSSQKGFQAFRKALSGQLPDIIPSTWQMLHQTAPMQRKRGASGAAQSKAALLSPGTCLPARLHGMGTLSSGTMTGLLRAS